MKIFSVLAIALTAAAAFSQVDPDKNVLVINGETIKGAEYYRRMEFLPDVGRVLQSGNVAVYPPGFLTIVQLINDHLVLQLAKQKGLVPTDQEIDDAIKETQSENPSFKQNWTNSGRTEAELRDAVKFTVIEFKLQTEGITVSDQEVADFYHKESIPGLTTIPRNVTLRLIAVRDDADEKKVDSALSGGKPFADVAKELSADATASSGGELGKVATDMLPKPVMDAVDHTKIGDTTTWVDEDLGKSSDGTSSLTVHVKYLIENKELEKHLDYSDAVKSRIRRKLMMDRGSVRNNIETELSAMRKSAKIEISSPEFAKMYENFMQTYFHETINAGGGAAGQ